MVRVAYLVIALLFWVASAGGRLRRPMCIILCYHGVRDSQRSKFERQLACVAKRAVGLNGIARASGSRRRPDVVFTFDDAFECLHRNALPLMATRGVPATLFAVSGNLGRVPAWQIHPSHPEASEPCMSAKSLQRAAQSSGISIGSHTATHPRLSTLDDESLHRELRESRAVLEELLGRNVIELALPHGDYSDRVLEAATQAGYTTVLTLEHDCATSSRGVLGRFSVSPDVSALQFRLTVDGAYSWLGSFRRAVRSRRVISASPKAMMKCARGTRQVNGPVAN